MKKIIVLFLCVLPIFGEVYNLDNFIQNKKEDILVNISEKKIKAEEKELEKKNYNEIKLLLNTQKKGGTEEGNYVNFNLSYGDFYYSIGKKLEENEVFTQNVGYSKNLNSFLYGEESYKINNFNIEKEISKINNEKIQNETEVNIINAYGNLLKIQKKIELQNDYKKNINLEKVNMLKKYENGEISLIDFEAFKLEEKSIDYELANLEKDYVLHKTRLFSLSGFYFTQNDNLANLEILETPCFENIGKIDSKILELKKLLVAEIRKYNFFKDRIQFDFKTDYTLEKNDYVISLSMSDEIKLTNFEGAKNKLEMEEIEFKIRDQKIKNKEKKEEYKLNYEKQYLNINLEKEKLDLERKNLAVKEKKYNLGELSYIDYLKEAEKFKEKEKSIIEKEIDLAIFVKTMVYL